MNVEEFRRINGAKTMGGNPNPSDANNPNINTAGLVDQNPPIDVQKFRNLNGTGYGTGAVDPSLGANVGKPYDAVWSDKKEVTVYPDGTVIERITGRIKKYGSDFAKYQQTHNLEMINRNTASIEAWNNNFTALTAGGTKQKLTDEEMSVREVRLKANSANTTDVLVGSSNLTTDNATIALAKGDEIVVKVSNLNQIYVLGATTGDKIAYSYVV